MSERDGECVPHRCGFVQVMNQGQFVAADHEHAERPLHLGERHEHRGQRAEIFGGAAHHSRHVRHELRLFILEERFGDLFHGPGFGRQMIDAEGRGRLKRVAAAGKLKQD